MNKLLQKSWVIGRMAEQFRLLAATEGPVVTVENANGCSAVLLVCEHASRTLPASLGTLGLSADALGAHIAWDPGALAVAKRISTRLDAALIFQNFSRLAYDCNRPPESPDAIPEVSEIFEIPGNIDIKEFQRQARVDEIYIPFSEALAALISERMAAGRPTVLITIHTFTPVYKGKSRSVEIGILHDTDARLADEMLRRGEEDGSLRIERNQPYGPEDGVTHTLRSHGLANGLLNVMIEVRNDLVRDEAGQFRLAEYIGQLVSKSLEVIRIGEHTRADAT